MAVPDYQTLMRPALGSLSDKSVHSSSEVRERVQAQIQLSQEDLDELLPSGKQTVFSNRVGWALSYMKKAGLLTSPRRGYHQITQRGLEVLKEQPDRIDNDVLIQFPEFREWKNQASTTSQSAGKGTSKSEGIDSETPEEALEAAYGELRKGVESELLEQIAEMSPAFFERLVVELVVGMGYGGSLQDAGRAIGKSGDGGIDGIIKEDKLGLDVIYLQAKRWQNTVGRPDVQSFSGSLDGVKAKKGIFLTTSSFSQEAHDFVNSIEKKIILIDGQRLAALMFEHNVGVTRTARYEVKRVDSDYFTEE